MALSAMIKHSIPTMPLEGVHAEFGSKETVAVVPFMIFGFGSFVFPVRISRVLYVPKWPATFNHWNFSEIVFRRRRTGAPLKRPRIPRIVSGRPPLARGSEKVEEENEDPNCLKEDAHSDDEIQSSPTPSRLVGVDAAGHTQHARNVHCIERHVETNHPQPEVPFTQPLVEKTSGSFREIIVNSGEDPGKKPAHKCEMEVSHDEIRIVELPVEGDCCQHDAGQTGNQKLKQERDAKQQGRVETQFSSPHRPQPVEDFDAGRDTNHHRRNGKERVTGGGHSNGEHMMGPDTHAH